MAAQRGQITDLPPDQPNGDDAPSGMGSDAGSASSYDTPRAQDLHAPMRTRSGRAIGATTAAPPTTPVHADYGVRISDIDAEQDLMQRRIADDQPFFAEAGVGTTEGAVPAPFGLIPDLCQLFEILERGTAMATCGVDLAPLSRQAIDQFISDIVQELSDQDPLTADAGLAVLQQCITSWTYLEDRVSTAFERHEAGGDDSSSPAVSHTSGTDYPFFRAAGEMPRNAFSFHFIFVWLLLNDYVISGMKAAMTATSFIDDIDDEAAQYVIASMYCEHGTGQNVRFISRNRGC